MIARKGTKAMAEPTEFTIGTSTSCSDGYCGEVNGVIIDPATRTVTHLVIERKHGREAGRLVPLDLVDSTPAEIRLRCTLAEFGLLDRAEETELVEGVGYGGGFGQAGAVQGYGNAGGMGVGGSVSGMGIGMGLGHHARTVVRDVVPLGETELRLGEPVHALDGEIGRVHGFLVDPGDHQVTHVLLEEGHLWGRKEVAIPISAVKDVDEGIRLNITKNQAGDLPPAE
jgi:sporulation protein YlmC with PRC-barrel domain